MRVRSTVAGSRPVLSFRYGDVLYGSVMGNKLKLHLESESFYYESGNGCIKIFSLVLAGPP